MMEDAPAADSAGRAVEAEVSAQHQVDALTKLLKEKEAEFGLQRKKFMDIYKQKESESQKHRADAAQLEQENARLHAELASLGRQVEDAQSQLAISTISKDEELEALRTRHQDELSSLNSSMQAIMEDTARQVSTSATAFYDQEKKKLVEIIEKQNAELTALRNSAAAVAASIASVSPQKDSDRSGRQKGGLQPRALSALEVSAERSAGKQVTARSAASYEAELEALRMQINDAHRKLEQYANDEQIQELQVELKNEKHARRDLEMYVAVLNEQKVVFQNDIEKLRHELREALELLNTERRAADGIRLTWQMANDQFLESHRLLMRDMKRMESLLTEEQQRRLSELQKKDAEAEQRTKKVSAATMDASSAAREPDPAAAATGNADPPFRSAAQSFLQSDRAPPAETTSAAVPQAVSSAQRSSTPVLAGVVRSRAGTRDSGLDSAAEAGSSGARQPLNVSLTEEQQKSLSDPQPEDVENKKLLDSFRASSDASSLAPAAAPTGKRLVSEKEWEMLQIELQASRAKLGRPCDMCKNYERELQKEQEKQKGLEAALAQSRQNVKAQSKTVESLEGYLKASNESARDELQSLAKKVSTYEQRLKDMSEQLGTNTEILNQRLREIAADRNIMYREMLEIQKENESILNAHSKSSQEMQAETINLPNNMEEMERLLLQCREQLIAARAAREHLEGHYASELMLVRSQLATERQAAKQLEESLALEISEMQSKIAHLSGAEARLNVEQEIRHDLEQKLGAVQSDCETKSKFIQGLKNSLIEQTELRKKLEEINTELKDKIRNLQRDLDSSEVVQRDFVRLSQELQVQLETIRHSENEVRWQHPEDVDVCHGCKKAFSGTKQKIHCKHCGKVFCGDCLSKVVLSGPSKRQSRVCDVCHTILVKDATPYFSSPR